MSEDVVQIIAHPTDFSELSTGAFVHALRMALATKSHLYLLHVSEPGSSRDWDAFPHARRLLASWGLMGLEEPPSLIDERLGVKITKVDIQHRTPISGLFEFILSHRPDLIVLATHGREGFNRWLRGSVSEEIARRTHIPTLFIGPQSRGFVDAIEGELHLARILIPIAHHPSPRGSLRVLGSLLGALGVPTPALDLIHIGEAPPEVDVGSDHTVEVMQGAVVDTISRVAQDRHVDLIAMPTAGREGFVEALRGSTTEKVLRQAPCPVLAIPARG
jgi:nucleotide-binding universal stress UspA family protein